ncbi:hypothetical protein F183_A19070 [Bryobacterales bacterium F-183]|nr:hypothetical protein F183_A19070 [Bryobacterales bacterium F-183]
MRRRDLFLLAPIALAAKGQTLGKPMPKFHAKSLEGKAFNNQNLHGRVILIQYWATWCGFCRKDQPAVDKIAAEFAAQGLVVLAVNSGEDRIKVKEYLAGSPRAVNIVLENDTNLAEIFDAPGFPKYVVINRNGYIVGNQDGAGGTIALRDLLSNAGLRSAA